MAIFQDYDFILSEIRRNLHDSRGSRATIMIGSGFSRNAVPLQSSRRSMPTWQDLIFEMVKRLYSESERESVLGKSSATSSALRLAQEFETAFGRPALIELVRETIQDDAFVPGKLHRQLLELPWSDVFTTNYDCLLEKASRHTRRQRYEVVRNMMDIPVAMRPRIVKLHGTLPDLENLVLTENDFRSYPRCRAPFVNLVQTSLAENSFCLFGFSGDDPNFLNWTGWVRDELGERAPFIYFFTYSKFGLRAFQRQLLESRRIIPVNLHELYPGARDIADAHRRLLKTLRERIGPSVPSWNSGRRYAVSRIDKSVAQEPLFPGDDVKSWKKAIRIWRRHREEFQGWVVLPQRSLERLAENLSFWIGRANAKLVEKWSVVDRVMLVRELAWRAATASTPLYDGFVYNIIDPLLQDLHSKDSQKSREAELKMWEISRYEFDEAVRYIHLQVLRHAREIGDDSRFNDFITKCRVKCKSLTESEEDHQFINYQIALRELGRLDHIAALDVLRNWRTHSASPIWKVRRASLYLECGEVVRGRQLLDDAFRHVRSIPVASNDYESLSTEGALLTVLRCLRHSDESNERIVKHSVDLTNAAARSDSYSVNDGEETTVHTPDPVPQIQESEEDPDLDESDTLPGELGLNDVDDREINERLESLNKLECEPGETLNWFQDILEFRPKKQLGRYEVETYEVGRISYRTSFGDDVPLQRAYQAIRFLEDAAIPLTGYPKSGLAVNLCLRGHYCLSMDDSSG